MRNTKQLVLGALFLAMGVILPSIFHMSGISGQVFLPMHISVLMAGFFLNPIYALLLGALTPVLNMLITGMPPIFPIGIIMIFELAAYGFITALLVENFGKISSLIIAMFGGRIVAGLVVFILSAGFGVKLSAFMFVKGAIITGLPGIAIQLIIIPLLVKALEEKYDLNPLETT